jgi:HSP20 family protein
MIKENSMNAVAENQNRRARESELSERPFVVPPANISADNNEYLLELDLPGVNREGLEIMVEGNQLTITGHRQWDVSGELCYCESGLADFRRMFELGPDVDTSRVSAEMKNGVLRLHLPKSEKARPKQIQVQVA